MRMTRFKNDFYHKWLYKNIDMMHAVTYAVQEQLEKFISADIRPKIEMIYLGVDEPTISEKRVEQLRETYELGDSFVVGIVGRIEEGKGQYKVIEAVKKLESFNIKALIIGATMSEEYLQQLKQKVIHLGLEEKVIFTGFTKDVNEHLQLCDVNVLATENETFGLVVIEAMRNQVAMIATAKGGPLEIIEDDVDGMLFDGSVEDLSKKIDKFYHEKTLYNNIRKAGIQKVKEKFNKEKQLLELYNVVTKI